MSTDDEQKPFPKPTACDYLHKLTKGVVSCIPYAGGLAAEVFDMICRPSLEKRRERWCEDLLEVVVQLRNKIEEFDLEQAFKNEAVVTTFIQAMRMATATHVAEKREALRNAVVNAALPNPPDEDQQQIYLNMIEPMTSWHLRFLTKFTAAYGSSIGEIKPKPNLAMPLPLPPLPLIEDDLFPELKGRHDFYTYVLNDLRSKNLLDIQLGSPWQGKQSWTIYPTELGSALLKFITSPIDDSSRE
jgi:hypothetical protein